MSLTLNLLRALFPKWSFFDQMAHSFELQYRPNPSSDWRPYSFQQKRRRLGLFYNPSVNLAWAQVSALEHLARDVQEIDSPEKVDGLTSYKLVLSILPKETRQFKIVAVNPEKRWDLFISNVIPTRSL